jgi:hypothetical protein
MLLAVPMLRCTLLLLLLLLLLSLLLFLLLYLLALLLLLLLFLMGCCLASAGSLRFEFAAVDLLVVVGEAFL